MQRFTLETRLRLKQNMVLYTDKKKLETQEVNETLHVNLLLISVYLTLINKSNLRLTNTYLPVREGQINKKKQSQSTSLCVHDFLARMQHQNDLCGSRQHVKTKRRPA